MKEIDERKRVLCVQLLELYKKQDEELAQYKEFIEREIQQAKEGSVFYQGSSKFSDEIKNTERELVELLTA